MRDSTKSQNTKTQKVLIIADESRQHQSLVTINYFLLYCVIGLIVFLFFLGLFLLPSDNPLEKIQANRAIAPPSNPAIAEQISILKSQVSGLVSGSIESKLRTLEENIKKGSTNNALGDIQELRREVRLLQDASSQSVPGSSNAASSEAVLKEISHLKQLVYLTLASGSLIFAAIAGIWLNKRYRLPHHKKSLLNKSS